MSLRLLWSWTRVHFVLWCRGQGRLRRRRQRCRLLFSLSSSSSSSSSSFFLFLSSSKSLFSPLLLSPPEKRLLSIDERDDPIGQSFLYSFLSTNGVPPSLCVCLCRSFPSPPFSFRGPIGRATAANGRDSAGPKKTCCVTRKGEQTETRRTSRASIKACTIHCRTKCTCSSQKQ